MEAIGLLMLAPLLYSLLIFVLWGCGVSSKPDVSASDKTMNGNLVAFLDDQIAKNGGATRLTTQHEGANKLLMEVSVRY